MGRALALRDGAGEVRYSRQMLMAVLVEHQRAEDSACSCGWHVLGGAWSQHVADCYEAGMGGDR